MSVKGIKDNKCLEEINIDIESLKAEIMRATLELSFPIGQSYITQEDINPSTILGFGTWERVKGKVLVGLDEDDTNFNTIGKTGGESTHKLTTTEIPAHSHNICERGMSTRGIGRASGVWPEGDQNTFLSVYRYGKGETYVNPTDSDAFMALNTGGNGSHNNLQPYEVIGYMWRRTA